MEAVNVAESIVKLGTTGGLLVLVIVLWKTWREDKNTHREELAKRDDENRELRGKLMDAFVRNIESNIQLKNSIDTQLTVTEQVLNTLTARGKK